MPVTRWTNADGLQVAFPNYFASYPRLPNQARALDTSGAIKVLEIDYDLTLIPTGTVSYSSDANNDGTFDGFSNADTYIPANATVLRTTVVAVNAAAGGTSFTVGTYTRAGAAIAATGLVTATEGVLANINAAGKRIFGAGALCAATAGTAGVGNADAYIGIATTGTFTAGVGRILIEYIDGPVDVAA